MICGEVYACLAGGVETTTEKCTMESQGNMRTLLVAHDYLGSSVDVVRFGLCYEKGRKSTIVSIASRFVQHRAVIFPPFATDRGDLLTLTEDRFVMNDTKIGSAFRYLVEVVDLTNDGFRVLHIAAPFEHRLDSDGHFGGVIHVHYLQAMKRNKIVIITPTQIDWLKRFSRRGIAVDDSHNITRYNLKLATVTVADEKDRGLPAAFLLSGTMTSEDVRLLFAEIKKLVPEFDPLQIVADEAPCFVNAFRMEFPNSKARLHYCRWHIDQTFKRATTRFVEARLRPRINKDLHDLLSINDLSTFEGKFAQILAYLEIEGQGAMLQYLKDNYLGRTRSWASFANHGVLDITMISERWHLHLKQDFLQRNANSRADFLVDLLIRAVEDIADTAEIRDRRRSANASYRIQETTKCHRWAMTIYGKRQEKITMIGERKWQLQGKTPDEVYIVTQSDCECADALSRNVHCPLCNIYPHAWNCTCLDNRAGISCLHRHATKLYGGPLALLSETAITENPVATTQELENFVNITEATSSNAVTEAQERRDQRSQIRNNIESKFSVITANVNSLVNTDTEQALSFLKDIYELVDQASMIKLHPVSEVNLAVRPELAKPGGKPLLTKAELFTRSQYRSRKKQIGEK
ncbi:unnamed protein product [Cylicocyclus nassatus]|uniref:MULE transposase domain-containing protein n=1 Tax=Cylicocyclus nassatus TaxID=53992 RepID=A0AA36H2M2_CYLNA|nr:unnamed protein product [Cylicocyclus nassatus]